MDVLFLSIVHLNGDIEAHRMAPLIDTNGGPFAIYGVAINSISDASQTVGLDSFYGARLRIQKQYPCFLNITHMVRR